MKDQPTNQFDVDELLDQAEDALDSNALRNTGVAFVIMTSLFLAWHSFAFFKRLSGGENTPALLSVFCVEASLVGLIVAHFSLVNNGKQKWIAAAGEVLTYGFLLFHASLNFRWNLFRHLEGIAATYQENGLPVLVFGVTLLTWGLLIVTDTRVWLRLEAVSALAKLRGRQFKTAKARRLGDTAVAPGANAGSGRRGTGYLNGEDWEEPGGPKH